jgi:hypothetical protein
MKFNDKEMSLLISRKVDRVVFQSKGQNIFVVDLDKLMKDKIESDEMLKKQLLAQVLQSDD